LSLTLCQHGEAKAGVTASARNVRVLIDISIATRRIDEGSDARQGFQTKI